jgi:hypothetical protein
MQSEVGMASIIIVENGACEESFERTLSAARSIQGAELLVIAQQATLNTLDNVMGFDASATPRSSLAAAIDASTSESILIIDARLAPEQHEIQSLHGEISNMPSVDYICASMRRGTVAIELPEISSDSLIDTLSASPELPLMCVVIRKKSALTIAPFEGESLTEILAQLIMKGALRGQGVHSTRFSLNAPRDCSLHISGDSLSRMLRSIIAQVNQTLAALFVRYGDLNAAGDCLRISDTLEDSPRSLALKGMMAQIRGETLGAVANMVASLQQYEMRKKDNSSHYVQFAPGNTEKISTSLQAGLTALNRSDNATALECFSEAVFHFDPFFKENGLESKS